MGFSGDRGPASDAEAGNGAGQAGGGRLGAMTCVWLWGEKRGRCGARVGPGGRFLFICLRVLSKAATTSGFLCWARPLLT